MVRTQIQLTEEQSAMLHHFAAQRKTSIAELIRQSVDLYLNTMGTVSLPDQRQRAIAAAGRFHTGQADLSENHDTYLLEAYEP